MNQMSPLKVSDQAEKLAGPRLPVMFQRPARRDELGYVYTRLMEAIADADSFSSQFKTFEQARMSKVFIANLHALDANYVRVCFSDDTMVGFQISGPERGNLWHYWSYAFPETRTPKMAMVFMRQYLDYWDNGRFHKVSLYTTHSNRPTLALMKRFGFENKCDLDDHVMGQNFILFERKLNKVEPGYDVGSTAPLKIRLMNRMRCALGWI